MRRLLAALMTVGLLSTPAVAQLQRNRDTMIPADVLEATATELSGARAFNNIVEIAGYERDRKADEYEGTYHESQVVQRLATEYGFSDVRITRLPVPYRQWDAEEAELWVTSPQKILVSRYLDHPAMIAYGSQSADVTAPLVWVGRGLRDSDYVGKDVRGKVVLTDWAPGPVHDVAVKKHGAAGVVSFVNQFGFGIDQPDQIAQSVRLSNSRNEALGIRS